MDGSAPGPAADADRLHLTWSLARVAGGDQAALEDLYRRTSGKLMGVISRIVTDPVEAEDVLQEAYLAVWRKAGSFDPDRGLSPITWLAAIARNKAIDRVRSGKGRLNRPLDEAGDPADPAADAFSRLADIDEGRRLHGCLEALEEKRALTIRTAFFEGLTHDALARRLEAPLGTVKSWIRRGLAELKACLES